MVPYSIYAKDFVRHALTQPPVRRLTEEWPIENEHLERIVMEHLINIGVYHVPPVEGTKLINQEILYILKNSTEIKRMIQTANNAMQASKKDKAGRI